MIDDDAEDRIFLSRLLEAGGYVPLVAEGAREGLEKALREGPDFIVLSVMFDGKGDLVLFDDLKLRKELKHIPVILLSSIDQKTLFQLRSLPGVSRGGFQVRPEGFLARPPEADDLLKLLKSLKAPKPPVNRGRRPRRTR